MVPSHPAKTTAVQYLLPEHHVGPVDTALYRLGFFKPHWLQKCIILHRAHGVALGCANPHLASPCRELEASLLIPLHKLLHLFGSVLEAREFPKAKHRRQWRIPILEHACKKGQPPSFKAPRLKNLRGLSLKRHNHWKSTTKLCSPIPRCSALWRSKDDSFRLSCSFDPWGHQQC